MSDERIEAGIALLDEKVPGWEQHIDIQRLNMGDCKRCILGQLYGDYNIGIKKLEIGLMQDSELGFEVDSYEDESYDDLTEMWKEYIR